MIHWVYKEGEKLESRETVICREETAGNFRKHLQEARERERKRKKRMLFGGLGVAVTGMAVLSGIYFRNPLYEFFSVGYSIEQQETREVSAVPSDSVVSDQVVVEELAGKVSKLPLSEAVETVTPTPVPIRIPTPTLEAQEAAVPAAEPEAGKEYVVQPGDTIASISRAHYGSMEMVKKICELNEISDGDYIQAGEIIVLP